MVSMFESAHYKVCLEVGRDLRFGNYGWQQSKSQVLLYNKVEQSILEQIRLVGPSEMSVSILGESGTGTDTK